jgi:hypothetical protein
MIPQAQFTVVAPVSSGQIEALEKLLETMNEQPGMANPVNSLIPFSDFQQLHMARLTILIDLTGGDIEVYGSSKPDLPTYLAFFGDLDGNPEEFMAALVEHADVGLRKIFSHCEGFHEGIDLRAWLRQHEKPVSAEYVNTIGRTVLQIREESALRQSLEARVPRAPCQSQEEARQIYRELLEFVQNELKQGLLHLTDDPPTPIGWLIRNYAHFLLLPLAALLLLPILLPVLPFLIFHLRYLERTDPEIYPKPTVPFLLSLKQLEDHDVSNQYTAFGSLKPGLFRKWLAVVVVWVIDWGSRHIFANGYLGRVQTIHFARWVFLDNRRRLMFASNYDGAHEAYMDDFINKVAFGLNLVFSNGVGWPRTNWLIKQGARFEQRFKYYQRRHQLPTQVWYKAYPGLTLTDIRRNHLIRKGLFRKSMTDSDIQKWLRLL